MVGQNNLHLHLGQIVGLVVDCNNWLSEEVETHALGISRGVAFSTRGLGHIC